MKNADLGMLHFVVLYEVLWYHFQEASNLTCQKRWSPISSTGQYYPRTLSHGRLSRLSAKIETGRSGRDVEPSKFAEKSILDVAPLCGFQCILPA